ncbi:TrmH family RNA methyltransferase [Alteribacillus iranensis]|uniref:RNA methyltransferase, TrmH family n=1 Tax=Alteribacillus iranensis TaxID=930128 RepID=A0A1I2CMH2_9BACI|nr:RNA methyltransferase [Alteribacillus iranensis]SFE69003.1 RNA methyltransferase, TrmH family [Alteribacillus iranensis]
MNRIESVKNPLIKKVKRLHKRKYREKEQLFIVEGFHLVEEALKHNARVKEIFLEDEAELPGGFDFSYVHLTLVSHQVMKEMSMTETPQGILAVCEHKDDDSVSIQLQKEDSFLFVDGVQDPGNLGTMIRTADAAGMTAVILGEGTVDPYNDKVIRATQGSLFHIPLIKGDLEDWIKRCKESGIPVFGSALEEGTTHSAIASQEGFALIVGNEGAGVNSEWLERCDQIIYVPIYGEAESLNVSVATGILLYHLKASL